MIGSGAIEIQGIGLAEVHAYGYEIRSSVSTGCMCEQQELPELHRLATSSTRHMLLFGNGHRNGMIWIFPKTNRARYDSWLAAQMALGMQIGGEAPL